MGVGAIQVIQRPTYSHLNVALRFELFEAYGNDGCQPAPKH